MLTLAQQGSVQLDHLHIVVNFHKRMLESKI